MEEQTANREVISVENNNVPKTDETKNKKKGKGCLIFFIVAIVLSVILFIGFVVLMIFLLFNPTSSSTSVIEEGSEETIVVLDLSGVITEGEDLSWFGSVTDIYADSVLGKLEEIKNDPNVKAVVLNIESPGGEVVASDKIYQKMMQLREEMPVIAYSGTMAASGGYYIASAADEFIVHPSVLTGSIGVILQTSNLEGLYEKLGIETRTFKSGEFKDDEELYDQDDDGEIEEIYQSIVDESYELFIDAIAEGRSMDKVELRKLADGRIYTGRQAVDNGLADSLGYLGDAIDRAKSLANANGATVVKYEDWVWVDSFLGFSLIKNNLFSGQEALESMKPRMFGVYYLPEL